MKKALVLGAGGFIGSHMVRRLKEEGFWVRGVDLKAPDFSPINADEFYINDLRSPYSSGCIIDNIFDEIYQFAADMGGAGYIFTGENDANVMRNSTQINLNVLESVRYFGCGRIFYSSSACIYPAHNQENPDDPKTSEESAYPAAPDSEYGWEKLFSERLYQSYSRNFGTQIRIGRYHNIFGPMGTFRGGKEKAPAALCRKVAETTNGSSIDIWGDGKQTRSFLYIDECIEATLKLMRSDFEGPVNIGSEEMVTIDQLARLIIGISSKDITIKHVEGPTGVRGRNSDNRLLKEKLNWAPSQPLIAGLEKTYDWVNKQVNK